MFNNTKKSKKHMLLVTAIILLLAMPVMTSMTVNAHSPQWTFTTYAFMTTSPSTTGVNQQVVLVMWLGIAPPPTAQGNYGDRWQGFKVAVTKPDGTQETLGPYASDPIGTRAIPYVPTQVGIYKFVFSYPGQTLTGLPYPPPLVAGQPLSGFTRGNSAYINDTYGPSQSDPVYLTVTQLPQQGWPEAPLPSQYWTRPINEANRNWAPIAGNWLSGAAINVGPTTVFGYGTAPESAHVMWTRPMWTGGLMDARFGSTGYATYHYEGLTFTPPIILNGVFYYNVGSLPKEGWYAVDLYTGKTNYFFNTTGPVTGIGTGMDLSGSIAQQSLAFGQIYNYNSPNQEGGMAYLWSTTAPTANTWMMYDAFSGNYMCSIGNVTQTESRPGNPTITTGGTGTAVYGKDGSILRYNIVNLGNTSLPKFYLQVWNTSQAIGTNHAPITEGNQYWDWRPYLNYTFDGAKNGFSLNASIPAVQGTIRAVREDQYILGGTTGSNDGVTVVQGNLWALNLKADSNSVVNPTLLWNITFTPPSTAGNLTIAMGTVDPEDGVFLFSCANTLQRWGYSLSTGLQLWGPTPAEQAWNYFGLATNIYQGKLLSTGYGGQLIAYNITTGKILWTYNATGIGTESPYGNYPIAIGLIADGKIYLGSGEHSPTQPLWRGSYIRCIDANTGKELWKMLDLGVSMPSGNGGSNFLVGDGYMIALNAYDNQIYCWGKGPSATSVTASPKSSVQGTNVLIEGSVTDQTSSIQAKGTPAISDADQELWMQYLYEQQGKPAIAKGVQVTLTAIDPNGNPQTIGTTTSNSMGNFAYAWTPPVPGLYTITATFAGSKSYYGSDAGTSFVVSAAPSASPAATMTPPTPTNPSTNTASPTPVQTVSSSPSQAPPPPTSGMPMTTYIAITAAVAIIAVIAAALVLRRRK
jgi:hypothetical protein